MVSILSILKLFSAFSTTSCIELTCSIGFPRQWLIYLQENNLHGVVAHKLIVIKQLIALNSYLPHN